MHTRLHHYWSWQRVVSRLARPASVQRGARSVPWSLSPALLSVSYRTKSNRELRAVHIPWSVPWRGKGYSRLPGHDTMVRVILPRSSFSRRTNPVWVIPQVLFPFTSSKMSPHLILPSL